MSPARQWWRLVPGAVVLLLGLGVVGVAGAGMSHATGEAYEYAVTPLDQVDEHVADDVYDGVHSITELPARARSVVEEAPSPDAIDEQDSEAVLSAPQFEYRTGFYEVTGDSGDTCLSIEHSDPSREGALRFYPDCQVPTDRDGVYAFENLSEDGQTVIREAVTEPDGTITRDGDTPPEFWAGDDATDPAYVVAYDGEYHVLDVSPVGPTGLGAAWLFQLSLFLGACGLFLTGVGIVSALGRQVRLPVAVLAGLATLVAPYLPVVHEVVQPGGTVSDLALLLVAGIVAGALTWGTLYALGVE